MILCVFAGWNWGDYMHYLLRRVFLLACRMDSVFMHGFFLTRRSVQGHGENEHLLSGSIVHDLHTLHKMISLACSACKLEKTCKFKKIQPSFYLTNRRSSFFALTSAMMYHRQGKVSWTRQDFSAPRFLPCLSGKLPTLDNLRFTRIVHP